MLLRKDDPWHPQASIPDVRNWRVVDANNREVGFVESVIVDFKSGVAEAIWIGPNERFAIDEIEVGDQVVRLRRPLEIGEGRAHEGDPVVSTGTFEDAYRDHFERHFGDELSYEAVAAAYSFGREMSMDAHFAGRDYDRAREDLRALWVWRYPQRGYEPIEDAVRFAYELAREQRRPNDVKRVAWALGVDGKESEAAHGGGINLGLKQRR